MKLVYTISEEERDHYIHVETRYDLIRKYVLQCVKDGTEPNLTSLRMLIKEPGDDDGRRA